MVSVRVVFQRDFDAKKPNHLLIKKMISRDMEFYKRVLFQKLEKHINKDQLNTVDTLLIHYNKEGNRNVSVTATNNSVAEAVQGIAEVVFPNSYKHAKE